MYLYRACIGADLSWLLVALSSGRRQRIPDVLGIREAEPNPGDEDDDYTDQGS